MQTAPLLDGHWPALLARLSGVLDLDASAHASGALRRRRAVADGATLLRLALAHGPGGLSLRSAAAWAGVSGVATLSDVALRKRLRGAADWLGVVAGALLGAASRPVTSAGRLRLVDASSISHPGAPGTAWRLHTAYDPLASCFTDLELTGPEEMESFARFRFAPGEVAVGDRGYARAADLRHVLDADADFVVRVGWSSLALLTPDGAPLRWAPIHAALRPGEVADRPVLVARPSKGAARQRQPLFPARLVVLRLPAAVEERALRAARRAHSRRRAEHRMQPLTASSCGYLMVLTSLPPERVSAGEVLAAYRLRWQVELAFKRLKSGLGIGRLLARDRQAARSWLLAHLILALLVQEDAAEFLATPPSAPRGTVAGGLALAPAPRVARRAPRRRPAPLRPGRPRARRGPHRPSHLRSTAP